MRNFYRFGCALIILILISISGVLFCQENGLITNLIVYDVENMADWSIQTNLREGDLLFGDRTYKIASVPDPYKGTDWIRTANDSKGYSGDTLAIFQLTDTADVLVALDDRLSLLDWLTDWTDTGLDLIMDESADGSFSLYIKTFLPDATVYLGPVGQTSGTSNYSILVYNPNLENIKPDPFDFKDKFDVEINAEVSSENVIITGISGKSPISVEGGAYAINNGDYTFQPDSISNLDQVKILIKASADYGEVASSTLTIGGIETTFNVRTKNHPDTGWAQLDGILANIQKPEFPDRDFNVLDFGAVGDGVTDCTGAFEGAISACSDSGGGRVLVPEGDFYTGPIHLQNNVNLHVTKNAVILFSTDPTDYLPVVYSRYGGIECYNYSPPIYAFEKENIAITGQGTLDGQASYENWWEWKSLGGADVSTLYSMAENGIPVSERVFGAGHYIRPNMIQPYRCKNILIDSVTVLDGPAWHVHPVLCKNVTISNITIVGYGPNNDGCNPECSKDVLIKNCYFDTGDDCIAIKSGRNADGRRVNVPTENVVIQDCTMKEGHGGVVIGSEISGGANNIFAEDCFMDSPHLNRALRIKTNSIRGGIVENIYLRNITVGQVSDAVVRINFYYGEGDIAEFLPTVRNIEVKNLTCETAPYALRFDGYARSLIRDVRLINCSFESITKQNHLNNVQNISLNSVSIKGDEYHKIIEPYGENTLPPLYNPYVSPPNSIELIQNYPNPFSNRTTIQFTLSEPSYVTLNVFDNAGQLVFTLLNERRSEGEHTIDIDEDGLHAGVYFCVLKTRSHIQTMKMIKL